MSKLHIIRVGYRGSENLKSSRLLEPLVKDWFPSIVSDITFFLMPVDISNKLFLHHSLWIHRDWGWTSQISNWKHSFLPFVFSRFLRMLILCRVHSFCEYPAQFS